MYCTVSSCDCPIALAANWSRWKENNNYQALCALWYGEIVAGAILAGRVWGTTPCSHLHVLKKGETARKVRSVVVKYWPSCHSFVGVFGYIKGYCLIHFLDVYGQDKAWNKLRTKFWKKRNGNSSQTLLAQKMLYMSRCFVATCTLLPLGGLTLLGLSAALCLGDVETASFEIFHNSKEIKCFLSFANQNLSCLRRKLPWRSNSWSLRVLLKSLHEIS